MLQNKKSKNARGNYAAIYQGKLYINNGEEFIKLTKKENDYYFYIYHRKIGTYYDALIGYKKFNSLKK